MEYTVNVEYNENCEYKGSKTSETLPIIHEPQEIILKASVLSENITIGEECTLTVTCTYDEHLQIPVKIGYVTINDLKTKCFLDENGKAVIKYEPQEIGNNDIYIRYHDDTNIFILPEPVKISVNTGLIETLTNIETPVIADLEESVNIRAKITLKDEETAVTYGRVTFVHYLVYPTEQNKDRIEKIIGNPVYLDENGEASITYIPMQDYKDDINLQNQIDNFDENKFYIEYIRAIYNYQKDSSGQEYDEEELNNVQWQYYDTSSSLGCIYIKQPNQIYLNGYTDEGQIQEINDAFIHCIEAKENIHLEANIIIEDESIVFDENDYVEIIMHGTVVQPKNTQMSPTDAQQYVNDNYDFIDIDKTYIATYDTNKNTFITENFNLAPGFYDFYGNSSNITYGNNNDIERYLKPTEESMHYYLQINYNQSTNIQTTIEVNGNLTENGYYINYQDTKTITVTIDNLTDTQFNALNGQECYLYNPFGEAYVSILEASDDILTTQFNITFNEIEDYSIHAYTNSVITDTDYIPPLYTNNINILVMGNPIPYLEQVSLKEYYPGRIEYKAYIKGLKNQTINGRFYNCKNEHENEEPDSNFDFQSYNNSYNIVYSDLEPGEYELKFKTDTNAISDVYVIRQATISHANSVQIENGTIYGVPQQQVSIIISSNDGQDLTNFDVDKLKIYIEDDEDIQIQCDIVDYIYTNNNALVVIFTLGRYIDNEWQGIYTEGEWYIRIQYNSGEPFRSTNNTTQLSTKLINPHLMTSPRIKIEEDRDNNINITIENPQQEYIPLIIELTNDTQSDYLKYIGVTNTSGEVTLTPPENKTVWNILKKINITLNPTNTDLINKIKEANNSTEIIYDENFEDNIFYGFTANENIEEVGEDIPETEQSLSYYFISYSNTEMQNENNKGIASVTKTSDECTVRLSNDEDNIYYLTPNVEFDGNIYPLYQKNNQEMVLKCYIHFFEETYNFISYDDIEGQNEHDRGTAFLVRTNDEYKVKLSNNTNSDNSIYSLESNIEIDGTIYPLYKQGVETPECYIYLFEDTYNFISYNDINGDTEHGNGYFESLGSKDNIVKIKIYENNENNFYYVASNIYDGDICELFDDANCKTSANIYIRIVYDEEENNSNNTNETNDITEPDNTNEPDDTDEPIIEQTPEEIIFNGLRNQLLTYQSKYLFTLYKESTGTYRRT